MEALSVPTIHPSPPHLNVERESYPRSLRIDYFVLSPVHSNNQHWHEGERGRALRRVTNVSIILSSDSTPGCLLGTIRALRACGQILFPITITYNNINSNSTLLHTNTSLDWHTLFSQGSGNLPFCMNVAVNIGSAFQGPESWPSFVYTDSRVEVAVKRLLPFVCSRFSLDAQQNKRWACISFSRVSLLASISRKLRLSACGRDL